MVTSKQVRRIGPLVAIGLVAVIVAVVVFVGGDGDGDSNGDGGGTAAAGGYEVESDLYGTVTLPEGVIPFSVAEDEGLDIDWPATCDTEVGTAAVPSLFAPACFAPFDGDNGGATAPGVTEDAITVVLYQPLENDPILDLILGDVSNEEPSDLTATYQAFLPYFEEYYETYGREVELVVYPATGTALDEVAARADAVQIAQEIRPFAVLEGPILTTAFADELAAQGVLNISLLGGPASPEYYAETDPYLFQVGMGPRQSRQHLAEYVGKQLAGQPAEHAGDPTLAGQERRFGLLYIEAGPDAEGVLAQLEDGLAEYDIELASVASYTSPLDVPTQAPGIIAQMKDAGVTSVILVSDPRTPATFTRAATDQDYFPEWIISGTGLTDSALYARTYDQGQWANAFGITTGAVRQDPSVSSARQLYRWYTCEEPPGRQGVELVSPMLSTFYAILQGAGPQLTHEAFRNVLFAAEPTRQHVTVPSLSWGEPGQGRWDELDYQGVDDATEIWWDPAASGPDETGGDGAGLYRFVGGGERYLRGEWPETPSTAFAEEDAPDFYEPEPGEDVLPQYPSPCEE